MNFHPVSASIIISLGGGIGAMSRFWVSHVIKHHLGKDPLWATLTVNITGSFLLGAVAGYFKDRASLPFFFFGTGICGGYTTFSTFSMELTEALKANRHWDAFFYLTASLIGGFVSFVLAWIAFSSQKS